MSLQIAYVANHGTRIDVAQNINQPSIYGQSAAYDPFNVAFGKTAAVTEYFLGFSTNYESLQVQLTRRFTKGLAFISAFTWGKAQNYGTGAQDGNLLFWSGTRPPQLQRARLRPHAQLRADHHLRAARRTRTPLLQLRPGAYVLGGWKTLGDHLGGFGPAIHHHHHQRQRRERLRRSIRPLPTRSRIMSAERGQCCRGSIRLPLLRRRLRRVFGQQSCSVRTRQHAAQPVPRTRLLLRQSLALQELPASSARDQLSKLASMRST